MDKYQRFRNLNMKLEIEKIKDEAPEICPLINYTKHDEIKLNNSITYISNDKYNLCTIPEWNEKNKEFKYFLIGKNDTSVREITLSLHDVLKSGISKEKIELLYNIKLDSLKSFVLSNRILTITDNGINNIINNIKKGNDAKYSLEKELKLEGISLKDIDFIQLDGIQMNKEDIFAAYNEIVCDLIIEDLQEQL